MSKTTKFDYENMVQESLRSVVRSALMQVAKSGLPGNHHFYISFRTDYPGVDLPDYLLEQYPEEITIVLQYEFWDLEVEDDCFYVTLCFNDIHERLTIPLQSIVSFVDPSVKFGLQFSPTIHEKAVPEKLPVRAKNAKSKTKANTQTATPESAQDGSNVVVLDAFQKNKLKLARLNKNIHQACQVAGRPSDSVSLLIVSKNRPQEAIVPFLEAGHRLFAENRVQETASKWPNLRRQYADTQLHLIGPLQTNKVSEALALFDVIETVDRPRLVIALAKEWQNPTRRTRKILIQINTGEEPQKNGVLIHDLPGLIDLCRSHNLPLTGLMCIPPIEDNPAPHFHLLFELAKKYNLADLSMGMSRDYPSAIENGTTWVRIGSALWI